MRIQVIAMVVALGGMSLPALSDADQKVAAKIPLVLMPSEGEAASEQLTADVERALQAVGNPAQRSAMGLEELMLAVECGDRLDDTCLQKIGTSIQARELILIRANKKGAAIELTLRWFDVSKGSDRKLTRLKLPPADSDRGSLLKRAVEQLIGSPPPTPAAPRTSWGGLSISTSIPDVEISIDGQPRGVAPLRLDNLTMGSYRIEAHRPGYVDWRDQVKVQASTVTRLEIEMVPSHLTLRRGSYLDSIRSPTWIVGGVSLACLAAGVAFGSHMTSQQNALDDIRGTTLNEIREMKALKKTGERDALAANILFGVGGAALLTAVVLSIWDYYMGSPIEAKTRSVVVRPGIGVSGTTVGLRF